MDGACGHLRGGDRKRAVAATEINYLLLAVGQSELAQDTAGVEEPLPTVLIGHAAIAYFHCSSTSRRADAGIHRHPAPGTYPTARSSWQSSPAQERPAMRSS